MGPCTNVLHSAVGISLWLFGTVGSCLCLYSTQQFSQFPVTTITCNRPGSADAWVTIRIRRCWLCRVMNCAKVLFAVWLQAETLQTENHGNGIRIGLLMHIHQKTKTFLLKVTVTLTTIQTTLLTQTSHNRLTIHCWPTVPVVHRFTGSPSGLWQTQPPHINKDSSPISILTARQDKLHPQAN